MSRLTKKHFEAIAHALRDTDASAATVRAVSAALKQTNPLFDKERFFVAAVPLKKALIEFNHQMQHEIAK